MYRLSQLVCPQDYERQMTLLEQNRLEITAWMERAEKLMDESELQGGDEHQFMVGLPQATVCMIMVTISKGAFGPSA